MHRSVPPAREVSPVIAQAIDSWVNQEHINSTTDRNAYLDDFGALRQQLSLPLDDTANFQASKHFSHYARQKPWGEVLINAPTDDYVTARHIFNGLMQLSGGAKRILYVTSNNASEYMDRKVKGIGTGVDTPMAVLASIEIHEHLPTPEEANQLALQTFASKTADLEQLRTRIPQDLGLEESRALEITHGMQRSFIHVVASGILMALAYRDGDLARVPFLEPKSISDDPEVIYPFKTD